MLIAGLFGLDSLSELAEAYMGGAYYYAFTMPRELWPLIMLGVTRVFYIALSMTLWIWTLKRFRRERIEAAMRT